MTDRIDRALSTADTAVTLAERLRRLFTPDPRRKAARLRGRAADLLERAKAANPDRAVRLRARAAGKLAEADALDRECP
jgi:hypothetical protein